jgi:hypothetical protein
MSNQVDIPFAKAQAIIMKRLVVRLQNACDALAWSIQDDPGIDLVDSLSTEVSYLMDALGMTKEER